MSRVSKRLNSASRTKAAKAVWPTRVLDDVCDVIGGGTPSKEIASYYGGPIPWATVRDMKTDLIESTECSITTDAVQASATNIIPAGNVIIATRVGLGKVCMLGQDTAINQDLRGIIPRNGDVRVKFLYDWLRSIAPRIVAEGSGATVQGVRLPFIKSLPMPLPSISEQDRIVAILDDAIESIAVAKVNAEQSLQKATEMYESYLESTVTKGGDGWTKGLFKDVCTIANGSQPPKSTFQKHATEDNVRLIQIRDYKSDDHIVFISNRHARSTCRVDDVMIGRYGPPVFQILRGLEGAYNVALMKAVPDESKVSKDFLFYFLNGRSLRDLIVRQSERASGQTGVRKDLLESYPFSYPSLSEQAQIVETLVDIKRNLDGLERVYRVKLQALKQLKQSLLHHAFSGNL